MRSLAQGLLPACGHRNRHRRWMTILVRIPVKKIRVKSANRVQRYQPARHGCQALKVTLIPIHTGFLGPDIMSDLKTNLKSNFKQVFSITWDLKYHFYYKYFFPHRMIMI